jgi:sn-glycerol 3-phosphate transport system substrate-binding protein
MNASGTQTYFDNPAVVEALQYWVDLAHTHGVMAPGLVDWAGTPRDFLERRTAMMWTTTGNLTNVKNNARFSFGVAMLPAGRKRGSPTGGGNFFLFRKTSPAQQAAVVTFVRWITSPERAARWGIDTGYVAVRRDAWTTPDMVRHVAAFPAAAVARDQLQYAVAELSTHDSQRVVKALDEAIQAALTATRSPALALRDAQAEAERILRPSRR